MRDGNLDERWYVNASETKEKTRGVGVHRINELNVEGRGRAGRPELGIEPDRAQESARASALGVCL